MSHRSFASAKVKYPSLRSFRKQCYQFRMSFDIVTDFYNLLHGAGSFHDLDSTVYKNNVIDLLKAKSKRYIYRPEETINTQLTYDRAARSFVLQCISNGWVGVTNTHKDILRLNEAFQAGWKDFGAEENMPTQQNAFGDIVPDFTLGLPPCSQYGDQALDFLRYICNDDYIEDVRLYSPQISKELLKVRDIALIVKSSLAYNKGKAKRDTNEKTDTDQQRSNRSLLDAKFLAKSEYVYNLNTRLARLASCQAQVLVPQKKARRKFARFVLIDCSGSMQDYERVYKAAAVVLDSIESVVKHGDTLHVAFFGDDFNYLGAVTKENAHDILLSVCNLYNYYTDNECTNPLQEAWSILNSDPDLQKLEIILLSDGLIRGFQPLSTDCGCKVHFINLSGSTAQYEIQNTIKDHDGTITNL